MVNFKIERNLITELEGQFVVAAAATDRQPLWPIHVESHRGVFAVSK